MKKFILCLFLSLPLINFAAGLSGNYTIGSGGDFSTITDAVNELYSSGVSGPVIFNIKRGTYNEQLDFKLAITGVSTTNTVTFQSESGNPADAEISFTSTSSSDNFIVRFTDVSNLIFNDLTFTAKGTTYSRIVYSNNFDGYVTFSGNIFNGYLNAGISTDQNIVTLSSVNIHNINFNNNIFNNGSRCFYALGGSSTKSTNFNFTNNELNVSKVGILISGFDSPNISNNEFNCVGDADAISVVNCDNNFQIIKNKIACETDLSNGILISGSNVSTSGYGLIANNFIQATNKGIQIVNSDYILIYFNSVNIENSPISANTGSFALSHDNSSSYLFIYNNMLINSRQGFAYIGNSSTVESNFNNLYTNGSNIGKWNGINYSTYLSFKSASGTNSNSYNQSVTFNSISDLHIQGFALLLSGVEIFSITDDIDGDARNNPPKIGADEYLLPLNGTYTIGSGGDYSTISDAIADLYLRGTSGEVVFNILNGSYNEQMNFSGSIDGGFLVTFQSNSGNPADVQINFSSTSPANNYIIKINGAQKLTFNNLSFTANGNDYSRIVYSENPAGYLSFSGNVFNGFSLSTSDVEKSLVYLMASTSGNLDFIQFDNNMFYGGSWGLYLTAPISTKSLGLIISMNTFETNYLAVKIDNFDSPQISSNTIVNKSGSYAIQLYGCENDYSVEKNKISVTSILGKGIFIYYCISNSTNYGILANNFIQSTYEGITIQSSEYVKLYYNSINIDLLPSTAYALSSCLFLGPNNKNISIVCNIFNNYRTGRAINVNSSHTDGNPQIVESENNNFFTTGPTLAMWNNVSLATLSDFQSTSGTDVNSYSVDVEFVSLTDLHIMSSPVLLSGPGYIITGILHDIDGDTRYNPTFIGADIPEYLSFYVDVFLEGSYNGGTMNTSLNDMLPLQQPYTSPIHDGNESVNSEFFESNTTIVDWVVVELRSNQTTKVASRAGFINKSGRIVDLNGTSPLLFFVDPDIDYYVVVYQRNHLPVMSANAVNLN